MAEVRRCGRRPSAAGTSPGADRLYFEPLETRAYLAAQSWQLASPDAVFDVAVDAPVVDPLVAPISGAGNTDAASLLAAGGPGDPKLPGFSNVGKGSSGNSTVTYLGNGWVITANHVSITEAGVRFGTTVYQVDMSSIRVLQNENGSLADLKVFRILGDPGLPSVLPELLAPAPPEGHVYMVGNGLTPGSERFWNVDTTSMPWVWTETAPPSIVGGWTLSSTRNIRWGENQVENTDLWVNLGGFTIFGFTTVLDHPDYTSKQPLTHEAQATSGDSGGAVFTFVDGKWVLSGIMIAVSPALSGQPSYSMLYGNFTLVADLSYYRDQILTIIATPGVVGRHVFYNQSTFDGNNSAANASDDAAIAPDKSAYRPGSGTATFDHITSYTRGINGIMVDIAGAHGPLTVEDFAFKIGDNNAAETWTPAPAPSAILVRPGAGLHGSDRVTIVWTSTASPKNTWLQVTVRGNDAAGGFNRNTGLASSDVFYFGNRIGDTGSGTSTAASTTATDEVATRNNTGAGATITNVFDHDRSGTVVAGDSIASRNNTGAMVKINMTATPQAPDANTLVVAAALPEKEPAEPIAWKRTADREARESIFAQVGRAARHEHPLLLMPRRS